MPPVKRRPRRRVGRPRIRRVQSQLVSKQAGGQFGFLGPILKVVAPLVATEIAKFGIQKGLKRLTGKGMHGNGLMLAGQRRGRGPARRRAPAKRRRKPARGRAHILPFPLPPGLRL